MNSWLYTNRFLFSMIVFTLVIGVSYTFVSYLYLSTRQYQSVRAHELAWTGAANDGNWENKDNWSTQTLPTLADHVIIDNATVTIPVGSKVSFDDLSIGTGGVTNLVLEGDIVSGNTIEIGTNGSLIQKNNHEQILSGTLRVARGGLLTHAPNLTTSEFAVMFTAKDIQIDAGGVVKADRVGYAPGSTGPGAGASSIDGAGGGGHGGRGGNGSGARGGDAYCSSDQEMMMGSGGGNGSIDSSGAGGGLINLKAAHTLTINGKISAKGYDGGAFNAGGGSGGGVVLIANSITGTPEEITINGGKGSGNGGGGGGGCMVVKYVENNSITENIINKDGGVVDGNITNVQTENNLVTSSSPSSSSLDIPPASTSVPVELTPSSPPGGDESATPAPTLSSDHSADSVPATDNGSVLSSSNSVPSPTVAGPASLPMTNMSAATLVASAGETGQVFVMQITTRDLPIVPVFTGPAHPLQSSTSTLTTSSTLPSTSTQKFTTSTLPLLKIINPLSHVEITKIPLLSEFASGDMLTFAYQFTNTSSSSQRFKITRQIVDETTGQVLVSKDVGTVLKPTQIFAATFTQRMPQSLQPGVFLARVMVFDSRGNQVDGNGFRFIVQKK